VSILHGRSVGSGRVMKGYSYVQQGESSTAPFIVTGDSRIIGDGRSRSSEPTVLHSVSEVLSV
jgi:hypothetical protein